MDNIQDKPLSSLRGGGDIRIAVIVDPELSLGLLANTVAVIAAGLGAIHPGIGRVQITDAQGKSYWNSADRPIAVLQADGAALNEIFLRSADAPDDSAIVVFPAFARSIHSFEEYSAAAVERTISAERIEGIGIIGPGRWVRSLTGALKLLR